MDPRSKRVSSIDTLGKKLAEGQSAGFWHEVLDQLNEGEMPPAEESQLSPRN